MPGFRTFSCCRSRSSWCATSGGRRTCCGAGSLFVLLHWLRQHRQPGAGPDQRADEGTRHPIRPRRERRPPGAPDRHRGGHRRACWGGARGSRRAVGAGAGAHAGAGVSLPRAFEIGFDAPVVVYTLALVPAISVLRGAGPDGRPPAARWDRRSAEEGRTGTAGRGARTVRAGPRHGGFALVLGRGGFAVCELPAGARRARGSTSTGLDWRGEAAAHAISTTSSFVAFPARCSERLRAVPGVAAAGVTDTIPFGRQQRQRVFAEGGDPRNPASPSSCQPGASRPATSRRWASGCAGRGRFFDERDAATSPRTIIVDDRMAPWPGADPIGKRMWQPAISAAAAADRRRAFFNVIGVVNTVGSNTSAVKATASARCTSR